MRNAKGERGLATQATPYPPTYYWKTAEQNKITVWNITKHICLNSKVLSAESVCGCLQKHQLWRHKFLFPAILRHFFQALYDFKLFSSCNISAMQCTITLNLWEMFIWLLINSWVKNKKIEIFLFINPLSDSPRKNRPLNLDEIFDFLLEILRLKLSIPETHKTGLSASRS